MLEERHDALWSATKKRNVASPEDLLARQRTGRADSGLGRLADDLQKRKPPWPRPRRHAGCGPGFAGSTPVRGATVAGRVLPLLGDLKMPHANMDWESEDVPADALGLDSPVSNSRQPRLALRPDQGGGGAREDALALKSVLAQVQSTPMVVLDEIDTGVSGKWRGHGRRHAAIAHSDQTARSSLSPTCHRSRRKPSTTGK